MRAGYWNSTNEIAKPNYVMIKQLISGFKITRFGNFLKIPRFTLFSKYLSYSLSYG